MKTRSAICCLIATVLCQQSVFAQSDSEFMPADGWIPLSHTGEEDSPSALAEGFPGLTAEVRKDISIEPVDGEGGFDNVAPRLGAEEGPGGLEWDPSPTYRTRYLAGTNYLANTTSQGNNWFTKVPTLSVSGNLLLVRFDANTYRVYDKEQYNNIWWGRYGNKNSKIIKTGSGSGEAYLLYDISGKKYTFYTIDSYKCSRIDGLGGAYITITHGSPRYVKQYDSSNTNVREFKYYMTTFGSATVIDKIEITENPGLPGALLYRKIDFVYDDEVSSPQGSSDGDLVGIKDERLLPQPNSWITQRWVFKYYTATTWSSGDPGVKYQVSAVLGPESVRGFSSDPGNTSIFSQSVSSLSSYADKLYEYDANKRLTELSLLSGCVCWGSEGVHTYAWDVNGSTPSDLNTWYRRVTITLPSANGSTQIIDYNKYGQTLNHIVQENSSSRKWIRTWSRDTTGRLTESFSVKACTSYTDSTHYVTTNSTAGQRFTFAYDSNSALTTVKLRDPSGGNLNLQGRKSFDLLTSGDRRRFVKRIDRIFRNEVTTDDTNFSNPDTANYATTKFDYTYHASDALAVKLRTTTLPVIITNDNGLGSAVALYDWFETDGLRTWTRDGDGFVHYTGYDGNRRTTTKQVMNIDTDTGDRPSGVPAPPDTTFNSSTGLNLVTDMEYDALRRIIKRVTPAFTDDTNTSTATTGMWLYTQSSPTSAPSYNLPVTLSYPHVGSIVYANCLLGITQEDLEGNVLVTAQGKPTTLRAPTALNSDFTAGASTVEGGFQGSIWQRTEHTYVGDKVTQTDVWKVASGPDSSSNWYSTIHTYEDGTGRKLSTKNAAGTITAWTYDVLNRWKKTKVGTVNGGGSDNMTLVEEYFYDDEEDPPYTSVGDGNLTRAKRYTETSMARTTDYTYDYRRRLIQTDQPSNVRETLSYTNLSQIVIRDRLDVSSGSVLMARTEHFYDAWGQCFRLRTYEVPLVDQNSDMVNDYSKVEYWRNGRGGLIKTLSNGKVLHKTQYDGAGRVVQTTVSYDTSETSYADASGISGDTVMQQTVYNLDRVGGRELTRIYERRHNGTLTGALTVGTSGNGRAQYYATWSDKLHRTTYQARYGTYGGTDLTSRPSGTPPTVSSPTVLVSITQYMEHGRPEYTIDPLGIWTTYEYDDNQRLTKRIENYDDGETGPSDKDRTTEYTYDGLDRILTTSAKSCDGGTTPDQVTENVFGVAPTSSKLTSNDLLLMVKLPKPNTPNQGQPSSAAEDQVYFGYNAQGELIWRKDQHGTERTLDHDDRGRLIHDRVTAYDSAEINTSILRISRTYDALDRSVLITSYNNATVGSGTLKNEVKFEYGKYSLVSKLWQAWTGAVTGSSPYVLDSYTFPTTGTTPIRHVSTTYSLGKVITDIYGTGTDDTINRVTGRKDGNAWLFQDSYLGLEGLVVREYGSTAYTWTLAWATDSGNNDNYIGLDRFGRIDYPSVRITGSSIINEYLYSYNYNSQVTLREDFVGNVAGVYLFDEGFTYDGLGRVTEHKRGAWNGSTWTTISSQENFTCDCFSNLTQQIRDSVTHNYTFNSSNEIKSRDSDTSYASYNLPSDMIVKGGSSGNTQEYDAWNRLTKVTVPGLNDTYYTYNGLNQIISRTNTLNNRYYFYNPSGQLVEETNQGSPLVLQAWCVWGTQGLGDIAGVARSTLEFYVQDANGTVVTRLNSSPVQVEQRFVYDTNGKPKPFSSSWSDYSFITEDILLAGESKWFKDHGQYLSDGQVYDPELGVHLQAEVIGGNLFDAGDVSQSISSLFDDFEEGILAIIVETMPEVLGELIPVGTKEDKDKVKKDIEQLKKDGVPSVKKMIEELEKSKKKHYIRNLTKAEKSEGLGNNATENDSRNARNGKGTGSTVRYDPDKTTTVRGDERNPRAGLVHELKHAHDMDKGVLDTTRDKKGVKKSERRAVEVENKIRDKTGDKKRMKYGGVELYPEEKKKG